MKEALGRDKRHWVRLHFDHPVRIEQVNAPAAGRVLYLLAEDLSEGGMRVDSPAAIAVGTRLVIDIEVDEASEPIRVLGEIVWIAKAGYQERWDLGVHFIEVSDAVANKIKTLVAAREGGG